MLQLLLCVCAAMCSDAVVAAVLGCQRLWHSGIVAAVVCSVQLCCCCECECITGSKAAVAVQGLSCSRLLQSSGCSVLQLLRQDVMQGCGVQCCELLLSAAVMMLL